MSLGVCFKQIAPHQTRLIDATSKFALFSVSGLKDEKLMKRQTYMTTETRKLYSTVFWTLKPNFIKIDPYNFELYRFKVGAFLRHSILVLQLCLPGLIPSKRAGNLFSTTTKPIVLLYSYSESRAVL